ncbi:MAG: Fur family transcriptional regulator [Syntrophobacter sp.]
MAKIDQVRQTTDHDHTDCLNNALQNAEYVCSRKGVRLTDLRRRVLELVWESHCPVTAYYILEALMKVQRAAPPTVYRALSFLQEHGLVHRIASLNAYVGCISPQTDHSGQFLICGTCQESVEILDAKVTKALQETAMSAGFDVHQQTVEIIGTCNKCRQYSRCDDRLGALSAPGTAKG